MGKTAKPQNGGGGMVADSRFAAVHYDPRFQRFPKAKSKVEIDERFAGIFKDEAFQVTGTVDKRGRKVKRNKKTEDMHRYYRLKEERQPGAEATAKQTQSARQPGRTHERDREALSRGKPGGAESDGVEEEAEERWARMRGLAGPETSSDEGGEGPGTADEASDDSEEEGDPQPGPELLSAGEDEPLNEADLAEWGVGALAANPEEQIPLLPDATARLAAVDLDWEHVRAVDILAVMRSFVPKGGSIQSVVVYPSDYGLERMGQEAVLGPQGIFKSAQGVTGRKDGEQSKEAGGSGSDSEEGGEVDQRRLRMYERSKLRYFYAIIACDSAATANRLYEECDGMEFMKTACKFDLRFVPEEQSFKGRQVRDEALDVPAEYMPLAFQARALQHTNVQLTWDADDDTRRRALTRRLNTDELKEDDFKAYLASESEDSGEDGGAGPEEDDEEIRQRYRMLLAEGPGIAAQERHGKKDWGAGVVEEGSEDGSGSDGDAHQEADATRVQGDQGMEMEVTFLPGLENLGERLLARKRDEEARKGETVWEAYMRRKRQKRAEAKRQGRQFASDESDGDSDVGTGGGSGSMDDLPAGVADDPFFQREADPFDDPFFTEARGEHAAEEAEPARVKKVKGRGALAGEAKQGKKGARQKEAKPTEDAARRAELEMLLLDDAALITAQKRSSSAADQIQQQQAAKKISKKERMRMRKNERRRERQEGSDDEDAPPGGNSAFAGVNLSDPRFAELVTSHHFALDPTDPRFKDTSASLAAEVAKRRSTVLASSSKPPPQQQQQQSSRRSQHSGSAAANKADLTLLVASLKRKTAAVQSGQARLPNNNDKGKAKKRRT